MVTQQTVGDSGFIQSDHRAYSNDLTPSSFSDQWPPVYVSKSEMLSWCCPLCMTRYDNNNNNNNNRICIAQVCRMTSEALDGQLQSCYTARARPKCFKAVCIDAANRFHLTVYDVINYNDVTSATNSYCMCSYRMYWYTNSEVFFWILTTYWMALVYTTAGQLLWGGGVDGRTCRSHCPTLWQTREFWCISLS